MPETPLVIFGAIHFGQALPIYQPTPSCLSPTSSTTEPLTQLWGLSPGQGIHGGSPNGTMSLLRSPEHSPCFTSWVSSNSRARSQISECVDRQRGRNWLRIIFLKNDSRYRHRITRLICQDST